MGGQHQNHIRFTCPSGAPQQGGMRRLPGGQVPGDGSPALSTLLLPVHLLLPTWPSSSLTLPGQVYPSSLSLQPTSTPLPLPDFIPYATLLQHLLCQQLFK